MRDLFYWPNRAERETRKRIKLSVAAYAYEFESDSLMSDKEFDKLALSIDLSVSTNRPDLDKWFKKQFDPCTGMWIRKHPELEKIAELYARRKRKDAVLYA